MNPIHKQIQKIVKKIRSITPIQIAVIILVVVSVVFVVKYYGKKGEWHVVKIQVVGKNWSDSYVQYDGFRPPFWLAEHIKQGDTELSLGGQIIAEVERTESYSRAGPDYDLYLTVKIRGTLNKRTNTFVYNGKAVRTGAPIELQLTSASVLGQIIDDNVPTEGYPTKNVVVKVRYKNTEQWIINKVRVNDELRDTAGNKIFGKIQSIQIEEPTNMLVQFDGYNRLTVVPSTKLSDLVLFVRIITEIHNGELFFEGHQNVKPSNGLWLYLPNINLFGGTIESVENVNK